MPRDGNGVYSKPPNTTAVPNTTIESARYNEAIDDIANDLNVPRPIGAGGTGRNSLSTVVQNLLAAANQAALQTIVGIADKAVTFVKLLDATDEKKIIGRGAGSGAGAFGELGPGAGIDINATELIVDKATAANIRAAAADKVLTGDNIVAAAVPVGITYAASPAWDWNNGIVFELTLTGDAVLPFPTNVKPGTWRTIRVIQDGTGGRTLTLGTGIGFFTIAGAQLANDETASSFAMLYCYAISASQIVVSADPGPLQQVT